MNLNKQSFLKVALGIVATAYLLYAIYQAIITTLFLTHFPILVTQLPNFLTSSQPTLQLGLFISQEVAASAGSYLRLAAAILALNCVIQYSRNSAKYIEKFGLVVLFESLYFLMLLPAAINHLVGSVISTSAFLNFYEGISSLLQALLIFAPLFILSRKLRNPLNRASILKWACIAAPLYVLGFWCRQGLLWVYALSSSAPPQAGLVETVGFVNSWLTLLVAAIVTAIACLSFRRKKTLNTRLVGVAIILVGAYFVIYDLVSIWSPVYRAFVPLTDFWMITLPILGTILLLKTAKCPTFR
jgi:hypothetical protein